MDNIIKITLFNNKVINYTDTNSIYNDPIIRRELYKIVDFSNFNINIIKSELFADCINLEEVIFPPTLKILGNAVFYNCKNLIKCDLSNTQLKIINKGCFYNCEKLEEVLFPPTLKILGYATFNNCKNLIKCDLSNTQLETINKGCFYNCEKLEEVIFPHTLKKISYRSFSVCKSLKICDLSETQLEVIEDECFTYCENLEEIIFPSTLKHIKHHAFYLCKNLIKCDLSKTQLEIIERNCFSKCIKLGNMILPATLKTLENGVFNKCYNLNKVYFEGPYLSTIDLSSLNVGKIGNRTSKTDVYYKFKNRGSWSKIKKKNYKKMRLLLYPKEQLIIILPSAIIGGLIVLFLLYKLTNKVLKKNKSLIFTIVFESCVNAIIFYILFAIIEFKFMTKVTTEQILKNLTKHDDIFINDLLGIKKDNIPEFIKPIIKDYIYKNFEDYTLNEKGIDKYINSKDKTLKTTMLNNLKNSIIIITPLVGITIILFLYYIINNNFNKIKVKLEWGHMFVTVFFIGIIVTLYEAFIIFYYLNKTNYINPYISYYLWARGKRGRYNGNQFTYKNKNIIKQNYKNTKSIDKYCSKYNYKGNKYNNCNYKECISKFMCDNMIEYNKNNNKKYFENNLLPDICEKNKNNNNNCFAP